MRPLLIRRYHRRAPRTGFRVYAARAGLDESWMQTAVLDRAEDLLDIDLEALGSGRSPGLVPTEEVLFCVCTHGKHDACCAEKGRPIAGALSAAYPEETWEVSHIGGDRFAGNALVLPYGLYLGRLEGLREVRGSPLVSVEVSGIEPPSALECDSSALPAELHPVRESLSKLPGAGQGKRPGCDDSTRRYIFRTRACRA